MNAVDRDDFAHALGQTLEFYGKELKREDFSFWYRALGEKDIQAVKNALLEYTKIGKYAPKPVDIIDLIKEVNIPSRQDALPEPDYNPCPPEIHAAWVWFIGMYTKGGKLEMYQGGEEVSPDLQERYLNIVNHEAQRTGTPEAIPDAYKLREVFGDLRTDRERPQ